MAENSRSHSTARAQGWRGIRLPTVKCRSSWMLRLESMRVVPARKSTLLQSSEPLGVCLPGGVMVTQGILVPSFRKG